MMRPMFLKPYIISVVLGLFALLTRTAHAQTIPAIVVPPASQATAPG